MWKLTRLALLVVLVSGLLAGLAACGSDSDDSSGDSEGDTPQDTVPQQGPTPEGTAMFDDPVNIAVYEPGTQVQSGLTLVSSHAGMRDGTAFFYAILRNDSGEMISRINLLLHGLDETGYVVAEHQETLLLNDIPPGQVIYAGASYSVPERYDSSANFILFETGPQAYQGFYDLPVTITFQGPDEIGAYVVRGTVDNTSGQTLYIPVIEVLLLGPDEQPSGLSYGVLTSLPPASAWEAGVSAEFEAVFDFTALAPEMIREAQVIAVGYVPLN